MGELTTKMTALADKVRGLGGTADTLSIAAMTDTISAANDTIEGQTDLIAELKEKVNNLPTAEDKVNELILREKTTYTNNSVTKVGNGAFYYWPTLTSISLPKATSIGANAFNSCSALVDVDLPSVTYINNQAFRSCTALETIYLPSIETVQSAFGFCSNLKNVILPKVITIDNSTFYNCTSLEEIEFPATLTAIKRTQVFYGCSNLIKLVLPYNGVVSLANINSFTGTPFVSGQGHIYVPANQVANYKAATNWSDLPASVIVSMEEMDNE